MQTKNLFTMETVPCPNCGSTEHTKLFTGKDYLHETSDNLFDAVRCNQCELSYLNPRPDLHTIAHGYPSDYLPHVSVNESEIETLDPINSPNYLIKHKNYPKDIRKVKSVSPLRWLDNALCSPLLHWLHGANMVPNYVEKGKLLEIGCASGKRLLSLKRLKWAELHGIELIPSAAQKAKDLGFNVLCGTVEEQLNNYPDNHFDVIVTAFVVEHLFNPFETFKQIEKKLKPGGQFMFSTIFCDSIDFKLYGKYWPGFDFPRHTVYFDNAQVKKFLELNNFTEVKRYHHPGEIDYWRASHWRIKNGEGKLIDKVLIFLYQVKVVHLLSIFLAWFKISTRVSYICKKNSYEKK